MAAETPLTDAQEKRGWTAGAVDADFARRLERDRVELIEALRDCLAMVDVDNAGPPNWDHIRALLARLDKP